MTKSKRLRRGGWVVLAGLAAAAWFVSTRPDDAARDAPAPAVLPSQTADQTAAAAPPVELPAVSAPPSRSSLPGRDLRREIQDALARGTPEGALAAAELIERCAKADQQVAELFAARDAQGFQDRLALKILSLFGVDEKAVIDFAQQEQRSCQGVDAHTRALRPALLQQALDGAAEGAAAASLEWLAQTQGPHADPARLEALRQTLRAEAEAGSMRALYALARDKPPMSETAEARHAYLRATDHIEDSWAQDEATAGFAKLLPGLRALRGGRDADPSLTREQLQAAEQRALRLFEAYKRREAARRGAVG